MLDERIDHRFELETKNFDNSVKIQEKQVEKDKPGEDMHGDFLYEHGALKEHREESAAIHQLTNMVMKNSLFSTSKMFAVEVSLFVHWVEKGKRQRSS